MDRRGSAAALTYQGRSGLVALLHRLGIEYRKPTAISAQVGSGEAGGVHQEVWKAC